MVGRARTEGLRPVSRPDEPTTLLRYCLSCKATCPVIIGDANHDPSLRVLHCALCSRVLGPVPSKLRGK